MSTTEMLKAQTVTDSCGIKTWSLKETGNSCEQRNSSKPFIEPVPPLGVGPAWWLSDLPHTDQRGVRDTRPDKQGRVA